jgi:hypothetical protein
MHGSHSPSAMPIRIGTELRRHVPFTAFGTLTGVLIAALFVWVGIERAWAVRMFWTLHPLHVLFSAMATTCLYRRLARAGWPSCILVGYVGAIGIASLSDCVIPYIGEWMIGMPNRGFHLGFIEKWWLVNPMALAGVALAWWVSAGAIPHVGHVLLSTWASLFHMQMAVGDQLSVQVVLILPVFLFLAVWVPCCTSDIVLPVFFSRFAVQRKLPRDDEESERAA